MTDRAFPALLALLEPNARDLHAESCAGSVDSAAIAVFASAAISLKRIADALAAIESHGISILKP